MLGSATGVGFLSVLNCVAHRAAIGSFETPASGIEHSDLKHKKQKHVFYALYII